MRKRKTLLQELIKEQMDVDPAIYDKRIDVEGDGSEIKLVGAVDVEADRVVAEEDARSVEGVTIVRNELLVGPDAAHRIDEEVAARCRTALYEDPVVPAGSVHLFVEDGRVKLTGSVDHRYQQRAAVHIVQNVDGVVEVEDCLLVLR